MSEVSRKIALIGLLGFFCFGGYALSQVKITDGHRPTGLKPIDAAQFQKIRETWPRIKKVHANRLGLERINAHRAKQGREVFEPGFIKPIGQEIESAIEGPGRMSIQAVSPNLELLGQLPSAVDNSSLGIFPPIGDRGYRNSCLAFATTYYQLSHMSALARTPQNLIIYSPKWTYNMINWGNDGGSVTSDAYDLLEKHGAATLAEFPYNTVYSGDTNYREWCLTTSVWQNALSSRTYPIQYIYGSGSDTGIEQIKELLNNEYILVFGTYIMSWQGQLIMDGPGPEDDDEVGKAISYFVNGEQGSHAMTVVGYDDAIWADVNGNAIVDPGEKGAFKIANSWGTGWQDQGFIWLAYDALRSVSAVPDGPSMGRTPAFQQNIAFVMIPMANYVPSMVAEFTVSHPMRDQLGISLGTSDTAGSMPSALWEPGAVFFHGGAFAFDGSETAVSGTFVFDFTDLLSTSGIALHYYLGMSDDTGGNSATLTAFKVKDLVSRTETEYSGPGLILDNAQDYIYVARLFRGYSQPPPRSIGHSSLPPIRVLGHKFCLPCLLYRSRRGCPFGHERYCRRPRLPYDAD